MQSRVVSLEEISKDPTPLPTPPIPSIKTTIPPQSRGLPLRLIRIFLLFLSLCFAFSFISIYAIKRFGVQNVVTTVRSGFVPSCIGAAADSFATLDRFIAPPSNLLHKMSDEELFWRATLVPRIQKYPFRRVPKVAFMFLSKGPLPLAPLWERFFSGHQGLYSIYLHSLPTFEAKFPTSSVFYRRQVPSKISEWGKMSMCDAERRLLANALLDISNEWFILLSESCIPLYNFSIIYRYVLQSNHSFLGAFDDEGPYGRGRYNENMAPEVNITQWRKGSQWFELRRHLAVSIVQDTKYYPKFEEFCKPHCYVDEHYFPTMLTIEAPNDLANRSITWVDWSRGGAHPATFGRADITVEFFKRIYDTEKCKYNGREEFRICNLFARKFSPSALEPLLHISQQVLGF